MRKAKQKQEIRSNHKNKNSFIKGSWTFRIKKKKRLNNRGDSKNFKKNLNFQRSVNKASINNHRKVSQLKVDKICLLTLIVWCLECKWIQKREKLNKKLN